MPVSDDPFIWFENPIKIRVYHARNSLARYHLIPVNQSLPLLKTKHDFIWIEKPMSMKIEYMTKIYVKQIYIPYLYVI
jgi:hypothetical protein